MVPEFEHQNGLNDRRSFLKLLAAAPLFATIGTRNVVAAVSNAVASTVKRSYTDNIYTRIGVKPLINARGTWTYLCGSLEIPATRQALEDASHYFVDMFDLQAGVGRELAKLSGAESGMITSGSAGAIAVATAGCIAGTDPNHVWQLPDTTGLKNEVIIMPRRSAFDSAIRLAGGKLVVVDAVEKLQGAITPQTAMLYTDWAWRTTAFRGYSGSLKPAKVYSILVDLADRIPPFSNFTHYAKLGVDMYCFSGGKGLCGPQCAGVLLGRKGSDRCRSLQQQSMGRSRVQAHEGRQGRNDGDVERDSILGECGYGRGQQGMAEPRGTHQDLSGYSAWSDDEHHGPYRRK